MMKTTSKVARAECGAQQFLELSAYELNVGSVTGRIVPPLEAIDNLGLNRRELLVNLVELNYLISVLIGALVDAEK